MKDPAVLFYTQDFITGTILMSDEQRGKYILLLCLQHQNGKLTERDMLKICGTFDEDIWNKFYKEGEFFYNRRMLLESEKRNKFCNHQKDNINKRWNPEVKGTRNERMMLAKQKGTHTESEWEQMLLLFKICICCEGESELINLEKDHIIALCMGGSDSIDNIQPLCAKCNLTKGSKVIDYRLSFAEKHNITLPELYRGINLVYTSSIPLENENENENENRIEDKKRINIPFENFWNLYDKKVDRKKCEIKWVRLNDNERKECIDKVPAYVFSTPDKKFRRDPETYLNNKSWENEIISPVATKIELPKTYEEMLELTKNNPALWEQYKSVKKEGERKAIFIPIKL